MNRNGTQNSNPNDGDPMLMRRAIELSRASIEAGGGPFGAVIVRGSQIVGEGTNRVTTANDPTAHAEVLAIRNAAQHLSTYDLSGCRLYSSCEPCPMCFGAILWARLDKVYFANTREDAAAIGFDDAAFYLELARSPGDREFQMEELLRDEALEVFRNWLTVEHRQMY